MLMSLSGYMDLEAVGTFGTWEGNPSEEPDFSKESGFTLDVIVDVVQSISAEDGVESDVGKETVIPDH